METTLYVNTNLATMSSDVSSDYGLVEDGALAINDGRIVWVGELSKLPQQYAEPNCKRIDLEGRLTTPALIDCHTHLVFGGNRAREFELRLNGASYEEISRSGGGIMSTVKSTRELDRQQLLDAALPRLDAMIAEGVGTIEIKSGYGLTVSDELKMLRVARDLGNLRSVRINTSFLGAHAIPPEYADRGNDYITEVCLPAMEQGANEDLIDTVDAFCEGIAFSPAQVARVFDKATELGLSVKIHAEQLSNLGGATLAASYGAISADHLEHLDAAGVDALKEAGSAAVLLPGAFYTLRETKMPPVELLRQAHVPIAIATDCNPGSSPMASLLLAMNMGCTLFRLTPEEVLAGTTCNAAIALNLHEEIGSLEVGKLAELSIWDVDHPSELSYRVGFNPLFKTIRGEK